MQLQRLHALFKLIRTEYGQYRLSLLALVVLSFVSGILEGIGINSVIPLFAFVNNASSKGTDVVSRLIEGFFNFFHITYTLRYLLLFIMALFLFKAIIGYLSMSLSARINTAYERDTRSTLFDMTLRAGWPYLSGQKIGHLEQVLTTDVTNSSVFLSYVSGSILIVANLFVYMLLTVNISALVALCTLLFGGLFFFCFKPLFYRNRVISGKVENMYKELAHYVNEHMLGMKTIKASAAENPIATRADERFDQIKQWNRSIIAVRNITNTLLQPIGLVFIVAIFAFFYKLQAFNFASFAVIVYAINKVFAYLQTAQSQIHAVSGLAPYVESIQRYRSEIKAQKEEDAGVLDFTFSNQLEFKDVSFSYSDVKETLARINFAIKKGELVGIIGPSGAGKTTIVDLLLRLYRPQIGKILLDGRDSDDIKLSSWRNAVGYVAQDMFLLNDTIEQNIKFYHPAITDEQMAAAARLANISDFISRQPCQYDTVIGERGVMLSGGEKQRIILARVLARRPEILVLDEATSALDNESEALIREAIERLKHSMTVIIIAHRLSTILNADTLIAIEDGKIKEQGSPRDLLADKQSYFSRVYSIGN